jgi:hydroxymethylpyrimidine/phosphomethylpyrimidine kinase
MVAKSGDTLLADSAIDALKSLLFNRATLLTPNLPEALKLVGEGSTQSQANALLDLGVGAVLMKGGHAVGATCTDLLVSQTGTQDFSAPRINTRNTHGTGCSYSSAIATGLARGMALSDAVGHAHTWLHQAILHADELHVGQGHGPVHHFHALWK